MIKLLLFNLVFALQALPIAAQIQTQTTVVKFNGDTLYCAKISAGGKNIVLETDGQKKIKLKASEVKFYIQPYQMIMHDGDPPLMRDTTRKCFVDSEGLVHEVVMENDSFYLTGLMSEQKLGRVAFDGYYIMDKNNTLVQKLDENKTMPDHLLKYFGGTCLEFDAQVKAVKQKFNSKIFPWKEWADLIHFYTHNCMK